MRATYAAHLHAVSKRSNAGNVDSNTAKARCPSAFLNVVTYLSV
jgi:hypothetical protein